MSYLACSIMLVLHSYNVKMCIFSHKDFSYRIGKEFFRRESMIADNNREFSPLFNNYKVPVLVERIHFRLNKVDNLNRF